MQFKDIVTEVMKAQGLKQSDICRLTDMSSSKVSQILKGKIKDPSLSTAIKFADALHVSLDYLAGRDVVHDVSMPPPQEPVYIDPKQRKLNSDFSQLSEDGRENAVASVAALLSVEKARVASGVQSAVDEAV